LRLLLDTHVLFWWLTDDPRLSASARRAIEENEEDTFVSIATALEIAIKVGAGKWPEAAALIDNLEDEVAAEGFKMLPISVAHARAGLSTSQHRDPFDRILTAQASLDNLALVTADTALGGEGVTRIW
jgi:PIN domain nuclease of toxin-antitoxin system